MPDREKVIKALEICYCPPSKCEDCPYHDLPVEQSCNDVLCLDALTLLKEQEAVEPTVSGIEEYDGHSSWWYQCGKCKMPIDHGERFCRWCGQEVKWDDI